MERHRPFFCETIDRVLLFAAPIPSHSIDRVDAADLQRIDPERQRLMDARPATIAVAVPRR